MENNQKPSWVEQARHPPERQFDNADERPEEPHNSQSSGQSQHNSSSKKDKVSKQQSQQSHRQDEHNTPQQPPRKPATSHEEDVPYDLQDLVFKALYEPESFIREFAAHIDHSDDHNDNKSTSKSSVQIPIKRDSSQQHQQQQQQPQPKFASKRQQQLPQQQQRRKYPISVESSTSSSSSDDDSDTESHEGDDKTIAEWNFTLPDDIMPILSGYIGIMKDGLQHIAQALHDHHEQGQSSSCSGHSRAGPCGRRRRRHCGRLGRQPGPIAFIRKLLSGGDRHGPRRHNGFPHHGPRHHSPRSPSHSPPPSPRRHRHHRPRSPSHSPPPSPRHHRGPPRHHHPPHPWSNHDSPSPHHDQPRSPSPSPRHRDHFSRRDRPCPQQFRHEGTFPSQKRQANVEDYYDLSIDELTGKWIRVCERLRDNIIFLDSHGDNQHCLDEIERLEHKKECLEHCIEMAHHELENEQTSSDSLSKYYADPSSSQPADRYGHHNRHHRSRRF